MHGDPQAAHRNSSVDQPSHRRAVLILGAGRSGTSMVARAVQAVGVELGDDFKPASRKNPAGFFEDRTLLRLSKRLRRRLGIRPDTLRLLDDDVWSGPAATAFYPEFKAAIESRFGDAPIWGFKYARTMRLLPFWQQLFREMQISPHYVLPIRNPLSVSRSRSRLDAHRGTQQNSDLEWLVNVVPYFSRLQGENLVVIDYDRLVGEPRDQLRRLAAGLDLPVAAETERQIGIFADEYLRPGLRHSRFSVDDLAGAEHINPLVRDAFCLLDTLAQDATSVSSAALYSDWQRLEAQLADLAPILTRIDELGALLRRAEWNPLSFAPAAAQLLRRWWRK